MTYIPSSTWRRGCRCGGLGEALPEESNERFGNSEAMVDFIAMHHLSEVSMIATIDGGTGLEKMNEAQALVDI